MASADENREIAVSTISAGWPKPRRSGITARWRAGAAADKDMEIRVSSDPARPAAPGHRDGAASDKDKEILLFSSRGTVLSKAGIVLNYAPDSVDGIFAETWSLQGAAVASRS